MLGIQQEHQLADVNGAPLLRGRGTCLDAWHCLAMKLWWDFGMPNLGRRVNSPVLLEFLLVTCYLPSPHEINVFKFVHICSYISHVSRTKNRNAKKSPSLSDLSVLQLLNSPNFSWFFPHPRTVCPWAVWAIGCAAAATSAAPGWRGAGGDRRSKKSAEDGEDLLGIIHLQNGGLFGGNGGLLGG